jgi:hypothetical protein
MDDFKPHWIEVIGLPVATTGLVFLAYGSVPLALGVPVALLVLSIAILM